MAVATGFYEQTDEQKAILEMVRQFVDEQIIPKAEHYDAADEYPEPIVEQMKELGLFGVTLIGMEIWLSYRTIRDVTTVPGFYAGVGFLAFGLVVLSGWPLGHLLRRREDYYEARSGEAGRDR